jgi:hypothetical protein
MIGRISFMAARLAKDLKKGQGAFCFRGQPSCSGKAKRLPPALASKAADF